MRACSTGYIENGRCKKGNKRVTKGIVGTRAESEVCEYTDSSGATISQKESSVCGLSADPAAFCKIGAGDQDYLDIMELVSLFYFQAKSFIENPNLPECHIDLGNMCDQAVNMDRRGAYAFSLLPTWINEFAEMENNPQCVKWNLKYY